MSKNIVTIKVKKNISKKETILKETPDNISSIEIYKPFLKWVGGKSQILDKVLEQFPKKINNYHEPFLGGGSVLLGLLNEINQKKICLTGQIYAYDINDPLIYLYKNIQENPNELYIEIRKIIDEFNTYQEIERKKAKKEKNEEGKTIIKEKAEDIIKPNNLDEVVSKESYYYWARKRYNDLTNIDKKTLLGSALFLFLNKTCWRGVFRTGKNGFNVPYGNYKEPEIINEKHLNDISKLIKNVIFICNNFTESLKNVKKNDFIYLDPPYAPETETSFVGYTDSGFVLKDHTNLFELCHKMKVNKIEWLMSNADVKLIRDNFKDEYNIESIVCRRAIHSKKPDATTNEVFIKPIYKN